MQTDANRLAAYLIMGTAGLIGGGAILLFLLFTYIGPFEIVDLGLSENMALQLDAILCMMFFFQHSVMVRHSFRHRLTRFIPQEYDAAFFAIVSGLILFILLFLWQGVSHTIIAPLGILRLLFRAVYFLSIAVYVWGFWSLGEFDPFGILPIINHLRGTKKAELPFIMKGPYQFIRHPLYTVMILLFWSNPDLTLDRLLFNFFFTIYMVIGTLLEEQDLVKTIGADYLAYQKKVPMLVPYRLSLFSKKIEKKV